MSNTSNNVIDFIAYRNGREPVKQPFDDYGFTKEDYAEMALKGGPTEVEIYNDFWGARHDPNTLRIDTKYFSSNNSYFITINPEADNS